LNGRAIHWQKCLSSTADVLPPLLRQLSPRCSYDCQSDQFRRICLQNPELALKVFKVLGHRLGHLASLVEELSFSTVRGRLIARLIRLADETGELTPRGIQFQLTENNEELAARLGTVRDLISRNLGRLHGAGLIELTRRTVNISDRASCGTNLGTTDSSGTARHPTSSMKSMTLVMEVIDHNS